MRYFLELSYNGKLYFGWQVQPGFISIQEKINAALGKILQENIAVVGAGRTDTGVHAEQLFAHFDTNKKLDKSYIHKLNSVLPDDIVVRDLFLVKDKLHARFDAVSRSYEYRIWLGRSPFLLDITWQIHNQYFNIDAMNEAAKILLEHENFKAFSKAKTDVRTFKCSITNAVWKQENNQLIFYISANRFLRNMVRAIVGTLLEVGTGKITVEEFKDIILSQNRSKAGLSVPAKGLFLTEVKYSFNE